MDTCQRCNQEGEDRRTLWMACFYDLSELSVPFKRVCIEGEYLELERLEPGRFGNLPVFKKTDGGISKHGFYTLRVCKECRADWMDSISKWFYEPPKVREGCESGIFLRENGAIIEVTEEEFHRRENLKMGRSA